MTAAPAPRPGRDRLIGATGRRPLALLAGTALLAGVRTVPGD